MKEDCTETEQYRSELLKYIGECSDKDIVWLYMAMQCCSK